MQLDDIIQQLRNHTLTVTNIALRDENDDDTIAPETINVMQSTHTESVHRTVSESAIKLRDNYNSTNNLNDVIQQIRDYISKLSDDSNENNAAKRCITRILDDNYGFTDPVSGVTIRQLLALTYSAIHDEEKRIGVLDDALKQFVQGLYEIQRGYNLSSLGVDDMSEEDKPICNAGTFNKLIEKLQGTHPDCQILFITQGTATRKLPIVVREEAMRYLSQLANPQDINELSAFIELINSIKKDGLEVIWDKIKPQVADRMFDEFGTIYPGGKNHADFIGNGQYANLEDLHRFQQKIQESPGYHQYCSSLLRQQSLFHHSQERLGNKSNKDPSQEQNP